MPWILDNLVSCIAVIIAAVALYLSWDANRISRRNADEQAGIRKAVEGSTALAKEAKEDMAREKAHWRETSLSIRREVQKRIEAAITAKSILCRRDPKSTVPKHEIEGMIRQIERILLDLEDAELKSKVMGFLDRPLFHSGKVFIAGDLQIHLQLLQKDIDRAFRDAEAEGRED